jgi:hypothetical protein
MRRTGFAALLLLACGSAAAGPYGDDLAKCLVESTTHDDRTALVRWMFAAIAAHPAVASIAKVTPEVMEGANKSASALFMRLLTESCKEKAQKALKYEGPGTLQTSFQRSDRWPRERCSRALKS